MSRGSARDRRKKKSLELRSPIALQSHHLKAVAERDQNAQAFSARRFAGGLNGMRLLQ
jgi:hypothetical protein